MIGWAIWQLCQMEPKSTNKENIVTFSDELGEGWLLTLVVNGECLCPANCDKYGEPTN